jgi:hypothetical protein
MKVPTDQKLLSYIYDHYYATFSSFSKEEPDRDVKIYVPIDAMGHEYTFSRFD